MRLLVTCRHLFALALAAVIWLGFHLHRLDMQTLVGPVDSRWFYDYTPYFPGMDQLETHEIFDPQYDGKKKIVLLGASATDSIGCDYTWGVRRGDHNVHYSCSITGQFNQILSERGMSDWHVFNLARNGAKLTNALYIYARVRAINPDIVIFGDTASYYLWDNAGIPTLNPQQIAYLDHTFNAEPETAKIWAAYRATLIRHGWQPPAADATPPAEIDTKGRKLTLEVLLSHVFVLAARPFLIDAPPFPVRYSDFPMETKIEPFHRPYVNPDPGFEYLQGVKLIAELQKQHGGHLVVYSSPYFGLRSDLDRQEAIRSLFTDYLTPQDILFFFHGAMDLKPVYETYDGSHQTIYGNRKIAQALFDDLEASRLLP